MDSRTRDAHQSGFRAGDNGTVKIVGRGQDRYCVRNDRSQGAQGRQGGDATGWLGTVRQGSRGLDLPTTRRHGKRHDIVVCQYRCFDRKIFSELRGSAAWVVSKSSMQHIAHPVVAYRVLPSPYLVAHKGICLPLCQSFSPKRRSARSQSIIYHNYAHQNPAHRVSVTS